jgi:hypothetical protein
MDIPFVMLRPNLADVVPYQLRIEIFKGAKPSRRAIDEVRICHQLEDGQADRPDDAQSVLYRADKVIN